MSVHYIIYIRSPNTQRNIPSSFFPITVYNRKIIRNIGNNKKLNLKATLYSPKLKINTNQYAVLPFGYTISKILVIWNNFHFRMGSGAVLFDCLQFYLCQWRRFYFNSVPLGKSNIITQVYQRSGNEIYIFILNRKLNEIVKG